MLYLTIITVYILNTFLQPVRKYSKYWQWYIKGIEKGIIFSHLICREDINLALECINQCVRDRQLPSMAVGFADFYFIFTFYR